MSKQKTDGFAANEVIDRVSMASVYAYIQKIDGTPNQGLPLSPVDGFNALFDYVQTSLVSIPKVGPINGHRAKEIIISAAMLQHAIGILTEANAPPEADLVNYPQVHNYVNKVIFEANRIGPYLVGAYRRFHKKGDTIRGSSITADQTIALSAIKASGFAPCGHFFAKTVSYVSTITLGNDNSGVEVGRLLKVRNMISQQEYDKWWSDAMSQYRPTMTSYKKFKAGHLASVDTSYSLANFNGNAWYSAGQQSMVPDQIGGGLTVIANNTIMNAGAVMQDNVSNVSYHTTATMYTWGNMSTPNPAGTVVTGVIATKDTVLSPKMRCIQTCGFANCTGDTTRDVTTQNGVNTCVPFNSTQAGCVGFMCRGSAMEDFLVLPTQDFSNGRGATVYIDTQFSMATYFSGANAATALAGFGVKAYWVDLTFNNGTTNAKVIGPINQKSGSQVSSPLPYTWGSDQLSFPLKSSIIVDASNVTGNLAVMISAYYGTGTKMSLAQDNPVTSGYVSEFGWGGYSIAFKPIVDIDFEVRYGASLVNVSLDAITANYLSLSPSTTGISNLAAALTSDMTKLTTAQSDQAGYALNLLTENTMVLGYLHAEMCDINGTSSSTPTSALGVLSMVQTYLSSTNGSTFGSSRVSNLMETIRYGVTSLDNASSTSAI